VPIAIVNNNQLYYEIHGEGEPAVCMGGWGTYCHNNGRGLARGLTDKYQVLVFDYRGIGQSKDDLNIPASMKLYSADLIALLDHLGWNKVHLIGLVGMGCGVAQEVALSRPELVRSMVNMGCWSSVRVDLVRPPEQHHNPYPPNQSDEPYSNPGDQAGQ
jgi:pimeloyl-ACP methyl ester carboxylesterase